jgi:hypothetical protein
LDLWSILNIKWDRSGYPHIREHESWAWTLELYMKESMDVSILFVSYIFLSELFLLFHHLKNFTPIFILNFHPHTPVYKHVK